MRVILQSMCNNNLEVRIVGSSCPLQLKMENIWLSYTCNVHCSCVHVIIITCNITVTYKSPKNDQCQLSPNSINRQSRGKVMRIN